MQKIRYALGDRHVKRFFAGQRPFGSGRTQHCIFKALDVIFSNKNPSVSGGFFDFIGNFSVSYEIKNFNARRTCPSGSGAAAFLPKA